MTEYLDTTWLPTIIEVLAIGGGLAFYLANWRARDRLRKVRYADMLLAELATLHRMIKPYGDEGVVDTVENSTEILPHNVYDGLVASTNLSYFDRPVQDKIHSFYGLVIEHDRKFGPKPAMQTFTLTGPTDEYGEPMDMWGAIRTTMRAVRQFRNRNRPNKRWRSVLKLLKWYYED